MKSQNLKDKIRQRVSKSSKNVFLRKDFADLGEYDQVGRALAAIIKDGGLSKLGVGLYVKVCPSKYKEGKTILADPGGFKAVSREALDRLGIPWEPSRTEREYNAGLTTQVPFNAAVIVKKRFSRKIRWQGLELICEGGPVENK